MCRPGNSSPRCQVHPGLTSTSIEKFFRERVAGQCLLLCFTNYPGTHYGEYMARFYDIHPDNPQPRTVRQIVDLLRQGGLVAYPTDSGYALGCTIDDRKSVDRMKTIRHLDDSHHFTLVCHDVAQVSQFVYLSNPVFRAVKAATPGPFTFILPATKEVPRRLQNAKKRTVGVRIPDHHVTQAIVTELAEPLMSTSLILPGDEEPLSQGWMVKEELDAVIDAVIDAGECRPEPTTVVDFSQGEAEIIRYGAGDPAALGG